MKESERERESERMGEIETVGRERKGVSKSVYLRGRERICVGNEQVCEREREREKSVT